MRWDQSFLPTATFPDVVCSKSSISWDRGGRWARSNIYQNPIWARHFFEVFSFSSYNSVKKAPLVPFYRWPTSGSQKVLKFFRVKHLPLALYTDQPIASCSDDGFLELKEGLIVRNSPNMETGLCHAPLGMRWWWGWNLSLWAKRPGYGSHRDWLLLKVLKWTQEATQTVALWKGNLNDRILTWT